MPMLHARPGRHARKSRIKRGEIDMAATNTTHESNSILPGLLVRPIQSLQDLPLRYRWEFTRRHPYYLMFWESAHRHYAGTREDACSTLLGKMAVELLLSIGVSADPPAPTAPFEALGASQLSKAWLDGAVAPLTYRALACLLAELPYSACMEVGAKLLNTQTERFSRSFNLGA
jgi:hypothetical protein